ncbi:putative hemin transport protein [Larkinella arboricola]|uniref:Putative hemin transport protein n=1 Tax=Larkinella arboricola TaxID=643671 RepID=A0A327XGF2_LARAB|nr:ChuX/HutX family heme-like substrate-binding protein [Larkinella arboricola]RAK03256.1 putative hemin transport protein [Larkinella arboricola]
MTTTVLDLKKQYEAFRAENPKVRIRDAAQQLGVSEAELLATGVGETVTQLEGDFRELLKEIPTLGYVMALTRNESVVHERKGEYKDVSFNGHVGLVLGEDIDLRLFMSSWKFGFAVHENDRKSLQFFAADGEAVHKIYLTDKSNESAYDAIVASYRAAKQDGVLDIEPKPEAPVTTPDSEIDVAAFQQAWLDLKDTHEFFGMLRKYKVSRLQAMHLAPEGYALPTTMEAVKNVFAEVSKSGLPIMIFVGNKGCIQIHTGEVRKLVPMGPWFNVLDPQFNMHLREDHVASAWVVKKPTTDGVVTSLELFDADGNQIALIFGKRKPGIPEKTEWREVVAQTALIINE